MPGSARAEIYFIAAMMLLILTICVATVFFFFKTYKKEMRDKKAKVDKQNGQGTETK